MNATQIKSRMRDLAAEAERVVADTNTDAASKRARLKGIEAEVKSLGEQETALRVGGMLAVGGSSMYDRSGDSPTSMFFGTKTLAAAPVITPSSDQMQVLHDAVVTRKSARVEIKTATDVSGMLPPTRVPGIVEMRHESTRVLDFIPSAGIASPSWEYFRHSATTGTMTTVAPGAPKPELSFTVDSVTGTVRKIAAHTAVEDETLMDFAGFAQYVSTELTRIYIDAENAQLLTGDGTGTNILGLLNQTGILARDYTTDHTADSTATGLDTLEGAMTDLRVGSAFATADLVVLHPTTWSRLRRTKDTYGNYILGDPSASDGRRLWGVPVITTTSIADGTGLVAQLSLAGDARIRQGITIDTTPYNADDWTHNLTRFRVEARIGLGVVRPAAICKVTNL